MSAYSNQTLISGLISGPNLISLTDDNQSGNINLTVLNEVITSVSNLIDAMLSAIYQVPFSQTNPPTLVQAACTIICCQKLMGRRLIPGEANPFDTEAKSLLRQLEDIRKFGGGLDSGTLRAFNPGHVERTWSRLAPTV